MKQYDKILLLLILMEIFPAPQAVWKKPFIVVIDRVVCSKYLNTLLYFECYLKKLTKGKSAVGTSLMLRNDLNVNAEIQGAIFFSIKGGKWVKFVDYKTNICNFLQNLLSLPLANLVRNEILKKSNFPCTCPVKGNIVYNITDFIISNVFLPPYMPREMNFNGSLTYFENKNIIGVAWLEGRTMPRN
uniref:MD-2-related lipid-recognition domain-containing protein n=1 Tax=Stomoxys calcitrans TaxID=35570 RepID=A0A1I8PEP9_STOCA